MALYRIGFCITAHGYGHAARAVAVMEALSGKIGAHHTIATLVPEWFFRSSFSGSFSVFPVLNDVGLVQLSALEEDLDATFVKLLDFYPLAREKVDELAAIFSGCDLVVSDIAPCGIAAAKRAGIPALLLENFSWDWVYKGYLADYPGMGHVIDYIQDVYGQADYHIQADPVCNEVECDLKVDPVARKIRSSRQAIRDHLGVGENDHLVLLTMGGEGIENLALDMFSTKKDTFFVIPGMPAQKACPENVHFLPDNSGIFHPDLVAASDAVVGKVGYSTLAEVYHGSVPFGYVRRPSFPESEPLVRFIEQNMNGMEISGRELKQGSWVNRLPELIAGKQEHVQRRNGADQCAEFIISLLSKQVTERL